jgi:hypothetical protein
MREVFILIAHLLVPLVRLASPRGLGAVAAESLAVKHQYLIMKRAQRRAPKLTPWDRVAEGKHQTQNHRDASPAASRIGSCAT